jgi:anthranilate phosphoribosyltransferase
MFAQAYHPSMKAVGPVRKRLGMRTVFNLLGPLTNPAGATSQVIGVSEPAHLELMGAALERLGGRAGAIVHSSSGLDEIGGDAPTDVYQFGRASVRRWRLDPAEFDVRASLEDLAGGSPAENAAALRSILEGERSPRSEVVALNAALALLVAEHVESLLEGLLRARTSLSDGSARAVFDAARAPRKQKMEIA